MPVFKLFGKATVRTWTYIEAETPEKAYETCRHRPISYAMDGADPGQSWVIDDEPFQEPPKLLCSEFLCDE